VDARQINQQVIAQFPAGAEIEGMHRDRLVLLTTVGARTGQPHTTPVMFHRDGDRLLVIASNAGAPAAPVQGGQRDRPWDLFSCSAKNG
jgi:F420H(2)-dependent quinone reductase